MTIELFISYSHEDEWLKLELLQHLSALKRSGHVDIWHDRKILPGAPLDPAIQQQVESANIFLFLISPAFLASDYCVEREYLRALTRCQADEAVIIPVIVRECDWDVHKLRSFRALPTDAIAVTKRASARDNAAERDSKWTDVISGIRDVVTDLKKKLTPPSLTEEYAQKLFKVSFVHHPALPEFDELEVYVDPEIYFEKHKRQINTTSALLELVKSERVVVISGQDRSGKSLVAKKIQYGLDHDAMPAVIVKGGEITNADILSIVKKATLQQYGSTGFPTNRTTIIIDDFDECSLRDNIKEKIARDLASNFERTVILSFSLAPAVLYSADDLADPACLSLGPLGKEKVLQLVRKWRFAGSNRVEVVSDSVIMTMYERIAVLFEQTEAERYAYNVVTFLELLESSTGGDIAPSSFAACFETALNARLTRAGCHHRQFDEIKNFLALIAYTGFVDSEEGFISERRYRECIDLFVSQHLSNEKFLRAMTDEHFVGRERDGYVFFEDYLWFYLCARYVGKRLVRDDQEKYKDFVAKCAANVFQKKYANIAIFIAYFTDDNLVVRELMSILDRLFSKAEDWVLSDRSRSVILGLGSGDNLAISASSNVEENRQNLLKDDGKDIIENAESLVAKYTLPFLDPQIDDSELVDGINSREVNGDSYIRSVNALLRTHSVIGQILNGRSGTYGAELVMNCITKMVQASGRYASLNHAIATLMMYDPEMALKTAGGVLRHEGLSDAEKHKRVMRIFGFWSVFISQTGLARYLAQPHSITALERLTEKFETQPDESGNIPYNFRSVHLIASLYHDQVVDRQAIERALQVLGPDSALFAILRATFHIYSYYMPLSIQDKQWLSNKLRMPIKRFETQQLKAITGKALSKRALLDTQLSETSDEE